VKFELPFYINRRGKLVDGFPAMFPGGLHFRIREKIGKAIVNPRGVAAGKKNVIVGV